MILPIFPILRWSPCTEGYPVEGVVYVGEDVEEVGGVELACQRNFHFCKYGNFQRRVGQSCILLLYNMTSMNVMYFFILASQSPFI